MENNLIEQKITKQVTITAGSEGSVSVAIPQKAEALLIGYGYTWADNTTYILMTGNVNYPSRTDQEGGIDKPRIFQEPLNIRNSGILKLSIANGDTVSHTYDVCFIIQTEEHITDESNGEDMYSTVKQKIVPNTATSTAVTVGATTTVLKAENLARKALLIQNDSDEIIYMKFGANAVMNEGIRLNTTEKILFSNIDGTLSTQALNGITASGSKIGLVTEFV